MKYWLFIILVITSGLIVMLIDDSYEDQQIAADEIKFIHDQQKREHDEIQKKLVSLTSKARKLTGY